jgi:hypothetical protein
MLLIRQQGAQPQSSSQCAAVACKLWGSLGKLFELQILLPGYPEGCLAGREACVLL